MGIDDDDAVDGRIDNGSPPCLARVQLSCDPDSFAQVVEHPCELPPTADCHLAYGKMEREHRSIASAARDLTAFANDLRVTSRQIALQVAVVLLVIRGRHQHADVSPQDLRFWITEKALCASIECLNLAFSVDQNDAVDRRIDDDIEPFGT
jgi:hypothetical protein